MVTVFRGKDLLIDKMELKRKRQTLTALEAIAEDLDVRIEVMQKIEDGGGWE